MYSPEQKPTGFTDGTTAAPNDCEFLQRKRINSVFDSVPLSKAVCLIAPFGYGKTMAVMSWKQGKPAIYCPLTQNENSTESFYELLKNGLLFFAAGDEVLFDEKDFSDNPIDVLISALLLTAKSREDFSLIFDDLNNIENGEIFKLIKDIAEAILGSCRVFLISRRELPYVFNDFVLKGAVRIITAGELTFDGEETRLFLQREGHTLEKKAFDEIFAATEGWPAALNAVAAAYHSENSCSYNSTAQKYIFDFFEVFIWDDLPKKIRDFLIRTSILDDISSSLCYAVSEQDDISDAFNYLFGHGLFIFKTEISDKYRYHPIFKEFLFQKLKGSGIDIENLYLKAAWWMYENQKFKNAFKYFYQIRFLHGIDKMLKEFDSANMPISEFLEMTRCITGLDPLTLKEYPNVLAKMALIEFLTGNVERMQELSAIFQQWMEPGFLPVSADEYAQLYWEEGWLIFIDPDVCQLNNSRLAELANYKKYAPHVQPLHIARCAVMGFVSVLRGVKDFSPIVMLLEDFLDKYAQNSQEWTDDSYTLLEMQIVFAEFLYETERLSEASDLVNSLILKTEEILHGHLYFICISLLIKIMRAMHDTDGIDSIIEQLEARIISRQNNYLLPNFYAFKQRNYLLDGNYEFLKEFLEENQNFIENGHYYLLYRKITYARVLLKLNRYHEALLILSGLELLAEKYKRVLDLIEIMVLKAIAHFGLQDEKNAVAALKKALEAGEPYGYIKVFSEEAADLMPVLNLHGKNNKCNYLKKIIISAKKSADLNADALRKKYSHLKLTKSELKILQSLRKNMTYQEISLEYGIKLSTVRTHIQSIYGKLDARNKTEAIMRALQQGII